MSASRYVVLALANVRSIWFREVGRWATAAAIPVDFVKCVSLEELRARLTAGRSFSAVMVDAGTPGLDRDLIDSAIDAGAAVVVVSNGRTQRDWIALGATTVLPDDFHRGELMEELQRHSRPLDRVDAGPARAPLDSAPDPDWSGRLVGVTGGSGAGTSTVAMGLAQGLGDDPRYSDLTLLADLALNADLAMLHDARDVVPGLQEIVDAHRTGNPSITDIRSMVFDATEHGYHLLLGLRRHRDWAVMRPRAVASTLDGLLRSYRVVVADIDPDFEGEEETGSIDVEERNLLARAVAERADVVLAVGNPTVKGLHDLIRVVSGLVDFGVDPLRIIPVLNRSGKPGRARAEMTAALGELLMPISTQLPSAVHLPEKRRIDEAIRDNVRLPAAVSRPIADTVTATLDRLAPARRTGEPEPAPVTPGSLGHFDTQLEQRDE